MNKFEGETSNGIPDGYGIIVFTDKDNFEGNFIEGDFIEGRYRFNDGSTYDGKFKKGKFVNSRVDIKIGIMTIDKTKLTKNIFLFEK